MASYTLSGRLIAPPRLDEGPNVNEWIFFIGLLMALIGFPTGWIDWAMNKPYDTWSFKGYAMGIVGVLMCWWAQP